MLSYVCVMYCLHMVFGCAPVCALLYIYVLCVWIGVLFVVLHVLCVLWLGVVDIYHLLLCMWCVVLCMYMCIDYMMCVMGLYMHA